MVCSVQSGQFVCMLVPSVIHWSFSVAVSVCPSVCLHVSNRSQGLGGRTRLLLHVTLILRIYSVISISQQKREHCRQDWCGFMRLQIQQQEIDDAYHSSWTIISLCSQTLCKLSTHNTPQPSHERTQFILYTHVCMCVLSALCHYLFPWNNKNVRDQR